MYLLIYFSAHKGTALLLIIQRTTRIGTGTSHYGCAMESPGVEPGTATANDERPYALGHEESFAKQLRQTFPEIHTHFPKLKKIKYIFLIHAYCYKFRTARLHANLQKHTRPLEKPQLRAYK